MKKYLFLTAILVIVVISAKTSFAQKQDNSKQKLIQYYSKTLIISIDSAKLIYDIMSTYKDNVKKVLAETTLTEESRRAKIDDIISEKNKKLELLLSPAQQAKIIPTNERNKNKTGK